MDDTVVEFDLGAVVSLEPVDIGEKVSFGKLHAAHTDRRLFLERDLGNREAQEEAVLGSQNDVGLLGSSMDGKHGIALLQLGRLDRALGDDIELFALHTLDHRLLRDEGQDGIPDVVHRQ